MPVETKTDRFLQENLKEDLNDFPLIDSNVEFSILRNFHQKNQSIQRKMKLFKYVQYAAIISVVFLGGMVVGNKMNHSPSNKLVEQTKASSMQKVKASHSVHIELPVKYTSASQKNEVVIQGSKKYKTFKLKVQIDKNCQNSNVQYELPSIYDLMNQQRNAQVQPFFNQSVQETEFQNTKKIVDYLKFVSL